MSEKSKTAVELAQEAAAKAGVEIEVVKPTPGTGSLVFHAKHEAAGGEQS
jgi:hypothetical protein